MLRMGTKHTRQQKHEWFQKWLHAAREQKKILSKRKLLAEFALECNSSTRTGNEILQIYADTEKCKIVGDEIMVE